MSAVGALSPFALPAAAGAEAVLATGDAAAATPAAPADAPPGGPLGWRCPALLHAAAEVEAGWRAHRSASEELASALQHLDELGSHLQAALQAFEIGLSPSHQ